jgi:hypothetical protein
MYRHICRLTDDTIHMSNLSLSLSSSSGGGGDHGALQRALMLEAFSCHDQVETEMQGGRDHPRLGGRQDQDPPQPGCRQDQDPPQSGGRQDQDQEQPGGRQDQVQEQGPLGPAEGPVRQEGGQVDETPQRPAGRERDKGQGEHEGGH